MGESLFLGGSCMLFYFAFLIVAVGILTVIEIWRRGN